MLACVVVPSGFWYVRNIVLTGNPLNPLHVAIFGTTIFQGCYGREAMQFSPYYLPPAAVGALVDTLLAVLDPRLVSFWLAAIAGVWAIRSNRRNTVDRLVWAMSGLAL